MRLPRKNECFPFFVTTPPRGNQKRTAKREGKKKGTEERGNNNSNNNNKERKQIFWPGITFTQRVNTKLRRQTCREHCVQLHPGHELRVEGSWRGEGTHMSARYPDGGMQGSVLKKGMEGLHMIL